MALNIRQNGIVFRHEDGNVTIHRPGKSGNAGVEIEVGAKLAEAWRLATGDVVGGVTEPLDVVQSVSDAGPEWYEQYDLWDEEQRDEPNNARGGSVPAWLMEHVLPTERLVSIQSVNGLEAEEAENRPFPRKRNNAERTSPDRCLPLAVNSSDTTGRMLDFAAPLGAGCVGIIHGPHASGLTRTLEAVVAGVCANAPDMAVLILLLRARGEEVTEWRRKFPGADVIVCTSLASASGAEQALRLADMTLACAQRQTELGRHVLLAVDSLTGLWGAMLEAEHADTQREADQANARYRMREWVQKAGNFGGPGLLGSALGGSLTLVGTMWQQPVDEEAEEERDIHPHLRLMEHLLHETNWRIPLSPVLMRERLFPAIDTARCLSQPEDKLLPPNEYEKLLSARAKLSRMDLLSLHNALLDALDNTPNDVELIEALLVEGATGFYL